MSKNFLAVSAGAASHVESGSRLSAGSTVLIKCGDCMHFQGSPHPSKGQICTQIGVKKFANAPACYTANVHVFRKTSAKAFDQLSALVSSFSGSESRVLIGLLRQQSRLDRKGFTFLERVYFRIGPDYLDNYVAAYALGVGPAGEILLVGQSYLSNQKSSLVAHLSADSLINEKDFLKAKSHLLDAGKLYEPRKPHKNAHVEDGGYQPPTLETSPEFLEKMAKPTKKRPIPKGKNASSDVLEIDLSSI